MTINWSDAAARLDLIERVGIKAYKAMLLDYRQRAIVRVVENHEIREFRDQLFGRLYAVGATGKAFATLEEAAAFARSHPLTKECQP